MIGKSCPLIFMHNPKTGGMSMFVGFCKQFGTDIADMYDMTAADIRPAPAAGVLQIQDTCVYAGHFPFGLHEWLTRPSCYMAIVRNPLDRILSLYLYMAPFRDYARKLQAQTRKSLPDLFMTGELPDYYGDFIPWIEGEQTLARFLDCQSAELDNGMVRRFSGIGLQGGPCPDQALITAKNNIETCFSVVGVLERYADTVQLSRRVFNWDWLPEYHVNALPETVRKQHAVDDDMKQRIETMNRLDIDLYDWVVQRLDAQLASPLPPIMVPGGKRTDYDKVKLWKSIGMSPMREAAMREKGLHNSGTS